MGMSLDKILKEQIKNELRELLNYDREINSLFADLIREIKIEKKFYHIKELSAMTGLSVRALKGRRVRGKIKMTTDANDILIETKEVERFLKTLR
jgi:hypothetical protein